MPTFLLLPLAVALLRTSSSSSPTSFSSSFVEASFVVFPSPSSPLSSPHRRDVAPLTTNNFVDVVSRRRGTSVALCALSKSRLKKRKEGKGMITLGELVEEMTTSSSSSDAALGGPGASAKKKKRKRTRGRVDRPKQRYVYAGQRRSKGAEEDDDAVVSGTKAKDDDKDLLVLARKLGLNDPKTQRCDPAVTDGGQPKIVGELRVGNDEDEDVGSKGGGNIAYVVEKPAGWTILGGNDKRKAKKERREATTASTPPHPAANGRKKKKMQRMKFVDEETGAVDYLEYDEADLLDVLTPEERAELEAEGGLEGSLAPSEAAKSNEGPTEGRSAAAPLQVSSASFVPPPRRPSLLSWLKDLKASEGNPIRGGKHWRAVAGASSSVDDSGLVLLCPKDKLRNVRVDEVQSVAVVGNGKNLAPNKRRKTAAKIDGDAKFDEGQATMGIQSKLRKNRSDDVVLAVDVKLPGGFSDCDDVVRLCQRQFEDGVRGDPDANPIDRRASRRLVQCVGMSVSSLVDEDEKCVVESEELSDDIAILANRRNEHEFRLGSFLGRSELRRNNLTNAYREINGAADGFPGWVVDRYDKWLLVQHDPKFPKGPLPSLHDGYTKGVYYLPIDPDRAAMGSEKRLKPTLMEGSPAPDVLPILENGITYHATLSEGLSTGLYLDQRPQRAWLAANCDESTTILNCFAHAGAYSVAAATAGAKTVSLDLEKKFLDRIYPQMRANGVVDVEARHDCIYGDCFDWLARLAKRGEKYDIVILDPPSTSVVKTKGGRSKKRWSAKNDTPDLVSLASKLVKPNGLLWTTTNSASIPPAKFAKMCKKGLEEAGLNKGKLERVAPMPCDFPSVGCQPVTNLVWRIP